MAIVISTNPRPVYDSRLLVIGQSLAQMIGYTHEGYSLASTISTGAVSPTVQSVEIINKANGGSSSCGENNPTELALNNYWMHANSGSPTAGPLLTAALAELTIRTSAGTLPHAILFSQVEADLEAAAGLVGGVTSAEALENYASCWEYGFAQLQAGIGTPVPIYIVLLGRSTGTSAPGGWDPLRQTQIDRLLAISDTVRIADDYDMALFNAVHPDRNWQTQFGQRFGRAIVNNQYGAASLWTGPTIASISLVGAVVEVHLTAESGDTIRRPSSALGPWGFKFYDGTTPLTATFLSWNGNNPKFTLSSTPADLHMSFIDDWGSGFDPLRLITGTTSTYPLQMKYL